MLCRHQLSCVPSVSHGRQAVTPWFLMRSVTANVVSAEILPAARQISGIAPGAAVETYLPLRWARFYHGQVVHQRQRGGNFDVVEEQVTQADDHGNEDVEDIDPW